MRHLSPRKLVLLALVLVIAAGAVAAFAAGGSGTPNTRTSATSAAKPVSDTQTRHAHAHVQRAVRPTLLVAATYLGIRPAQLRRELRDGKSLAQIAGETPGKSEAGLVSAVELAQQQHKVTKAKQRLHKRVTAQVRAHGGPRSRRRILSLREDARIYLGVSLAQLRSQERAGKSLAQIAQDTPGKSEAGLEQAIYAARKQQLEGAVAAGSMRAAPESAALARLKRRLHAYVGRVLNRTQRASIAPAAS